MSILSRLVEFGALTPLSCHFARFIARQSGQAEDSLLVLTAALLSQSNQQGDVCLDLGRRSGMPLFEHAPVPAGTYSAIAETAAPALAQWQVALLQSHCVGNPGEVAPLILDGPRLYLQRYWSDEQTVYHAINARLQLVQDIDLARLHRPDLILMDIQLPEVSGLQVTQWIKNDEELKHIPVIAITAFAMKGDEEKIRQGGCEAYLSKPISVVKFLETVKNYLGDR